MSLSPASHASSEDEVRPKSAGQAVHAGRFSHTISRKRRLVFRQRVGDFEFPTIDFRAVPDGTHAHPVSPWTQYLERNEENRHLERRIPEVSGSPLESPCKPVVGTPTDGYTHGPPAAPTRRHGIECNEDRQDLLTTPWDDRSSRTTNAAHRAIEQEPSCRALRPLRSGGRPR